MVKMGNSLAYLILVKLVVLEVVLQFGARQLKPALTSGFFLLFFCLKIGQQHCIDNVNDTVNCFYVGGNDGCTIYFQNAVFKC